MMGGPPASRWCQISPWRTRSRIGLGFTADDPDLTGARGFLLASGVTGPLTPVDVPGAPRTAPAALNDCGRIVGLYENPNAQPAGPTDL
jgi:hypothetical protein